MKVLNEIYELVNLDKMVIIISHEEYPIDNDKINFIKIVLNKQVNLND